MSVFGVILVRIFPHSDWIRRDTLYLSVFSPNAGKCRPDYLRIRAIITQCIKSIFIHNIVNTSVVFKNLEKGSIWLWIQIILNKMMFFRDINFGVNFHRECQGVTTVRRLVTKCQRNRSIVQEISILIS